MADIQNGKIPKRFIEEFAQAKPKNYKKMKTTDEELM